MKRPARSGRNGRARPVRRNRASRTTRPRRARRLRACRPTASGMLGIIAATRSPCLTPSETKSCCRRETSAWSSSQERRRSTLSSPLKTMASPEPRLAQQVFGEVQPRVGKERRARHPVAVDKHAFALLADDAAEIPEQAPEILAVVDRPAVQLGIGGEGRAGPGGSLDHEGRDRRLCDTVWRRHPERHVINH